MAVHNGERSIMSVRAKNYVTPHWRRDRWSKSKDNMQICSNRAMLTASWVLYRIHSGNDKPQFNLDRNLAYSQKEI